MPHDTMPPDLSFDPAAETFPELTPQEPSGILALMKQAGRSFVAKAKSAGSKTVLAAMMVAAAALCSPQAMKAADVTVTITGTVTSGTDTSGIFTSPGGNLAGYAVTLTYAFDDGLGSTYTGVCSGVPCYTTMTSSGTPQTATLTIGYGSYNFGLYPTSSANAEAQREIPPSYPSYMYYTVAEYYALSGVSSGSAGVTAQIHTATGSPPFSMDPDWESSVSRLSGIGTTTGSFNISYNPVMGSYQAASGSFTIDTVTVIGTPPFNSVAKSLGSPHNIPGCPICLGDNPADAGRNATDNPDGQLPPNSSPTMVSERGDPVFVGNGNMFEEVKDYATAGQNPLEFIRYYNSLGNGPGVATYAGTLGVNWRSNYDRYLQLDSASSPTAVTAERADGSIASFTLSGSTWVPETDVDMTLTQAGSTWTLTDHNDTVETYTVSGVKGTLDSIALRNGYTQTLSYSGGLLDTVTDSYGRSLSFSYSGGLLSGPRRRTRSASPMVIRA